MSNDEHTIQNELNLLHKILRTTIKEKWDRSLPFADELFDRWERAKFLGFGENTSVYDSALIIGPVKVGKNTWIGPFTVLDGSGGLEIGDNCSISSGVQIYSHDSVNWALSGGIVPYEKKRVKIGNCCYIGPHSIISKGVTIGDHSLIGAQCLVNNDIPNNSIVFGVPGKICGNVEILPSGSIHLKFFENDQK